MSVYDLLIPGKKEWCNLNINSVSFFGTAGGAPGTYYGVTTVPNSLLFSVNGVNNSYVFVDGNGDPLLKIFDSGAIMFPVLPTLITANSGTITALMMLEKVITIKNTGASNYTFDSAANIVSAISAASGSSNLSFQFTIYIPQATNINTVTFAAGTGMTFPNGSPTFASTDRLTLTCTLLVVDANTVLLYF